MVLTTLLWSSVELCAEVSDLNLGPEWTEQKSTAANRVWSRNGSSEVISIKAFEVPSENHRTEDGNLANDELLRSEKAKALALGKIGIREWKVHERRKVVLHGRNASLRVGSYKNPAGRPIQFIETDDGARSILFTKESPRGLEPEKVRAFLAMFDKRSP